MQLLQCKLITGEWIIGQVKEQLQETNSVILEKPLVVHVVPRGPSDYGIALIPFNPVSADTTVEVFKSAIIAKPDKIEKGLHDAYIRNATNLEIVQDLADLSGGDDK